MGRRKPVTHILDIYGYPIHLATDIKQWRVLRKTFDVLPEDPGAFARTNSILELSDGGPTLLHLAFYIDVEGHDPAEPGELVQTCAHEAAHGAGLLLDHIGAAYDGENEPFAYLVGWLALWLWHHADEARHAHV